MGARPGRVGREARGRVAIPADSSLTARARAYRNRPRKQNKAAFREVVKGGPPGLLAFDGDVAIGWCQLTPRDALPWLDRTWRLKRVDDVPVWSLCCFYVRIGYRRQGITSHLIAAALEAAKRAKAPAGDRPIKAANARTCRT
jgi:GNAT superfamily N-acetyltransferase